MFEHIPFTTKQFTPPKQRQVIQEWQGPATTKSRDEVHMSLIGTADAEPRGS